MIIESKPFMPSKALEDEYKRELRDLLKDMLKETSNEVVNMYKQSGFAMDADFTDFEKRFNDLKEKFEKIFKEKGLEVAKRMVMRQFRYCRSTFNKIMERLLPKENAFTIQGSAIPKSQEEIIKASIYENVSLIKSIPAKYFEDVTGAVVRSMQDSGSIKQLKEQILRFNNITKKRANLIALDQTRKTYTAITKKNLQEVGLTKVKWLHSGGGEPREYHIRKWDGKSGLKDGRPNGLNGFIFDINNPPVIEHACEPKTARGTYRPEVRGLPTQLVNCKCVMRAIVEI